jgi:hypothetical protein
VKEVIVQLTYIYKWQPSFFLCILVQTISQQDQFKNKGEENGLWGEKQSGDSQYL